MCLKPKSERKKMKSFYTLCVVIAVFISGFFAGYVFSEQMGSRVAVVDVAKVVASSAQVQGLKAEQDAQNAELVQWIQNAQNSVNEEKDQEKKEKLAQQLNEELNAKRNAFAQRYVTALQAIEQSINSTITDEAHKKGYKFIIAKGMILGGGDDITDDVIKVVK